jgi:protoporphyrinogen oxidase
MKLNASFGLLIAGFRPLAITGFTLTSSPHRTYAETLFRATKEGSEETPGKEEGELKSAAIEWAAEQKKVDAEQEKVDAEQEKVDDSTKKKFAIVGGGWGGWGAAKALCQSQEDIEVTLLDALPDPTGKTPYLSKTGKPVEAGTRGFWKDYPNINSVW